LRLKLAYVVALALVAFAAGCGGSSKSSAPAFETTVEATTTEETTTAEATTADETTAAETTAAETTSSNDSTPSFVSSKNCLELLNLSAAFAKAAAAANGKNDIDTTVKFFETVADKAPGDIKGDFKLIATAFAAYAKALKDAHFTVGQQPTPEQIEKLTKAAESFDNAKVQKASEHIQAWAKKNCSS
jgi:hypothetical protein